MILPLSQLEEKNIKIMGISKKIANFFSAASRSQQKKCSCKKCPTDVTKGGVFIACPERVAKVLKENGTLDALREQMQYMKVLKKPKKHAAKPKKKYR